MGTINTIAEMNNNKMIIGGDFKYVSHNGVILGAKFAAYWDGYHWNPTLISNDNSYLAGWKLLSAEAVGDIVFAIADQGRDTDLLPLIRWREDDGWSYLYKRPEILDTQLWDNTKGT